MAEIQKYNTWKIGRTASTFDENLFLDFLDLNNDGAGDFYTYTGFNNSPVVLNTFTVSDENGMLVLYTDGVDVYDKNGDVITIGGEISPWNLYNGNPSSGMFGDKYAIQGTVIIPKPLSVEERTANLQTPTKYFVVTASTKGATIYDNGYPVTDCIATSVTKQYCRGINANENGALHYSTVDISLTNVTQGEFIEVNKTIGRTGTNFFKISDFVAVTKHANGNDYWLLALGYGVDSGKIFSFLVTEFGVEEFPTKVFGSSITKVDNGSLLKNIANLSISENGDKIVITSSDEQNNNSGVFLYTFDNTNGNIGNELIFGENDTAEFEVPTRVEKLFTYNVSTENFPTQYTDYTVVGPGYANNPFFNFSNGTYIVQKNLIHYFNYYIELPDFIPDLYFKIRVKNTNDNSYIYETDYTKFLTFDASVSGAFSPTTNLVGVPLSFDITFYTGDDTNKTPATGVDIQSNLLDIKYKETRAYTTYFTGSEFSRNSKFVYYGTANFVPAYSDVDTYMFEEKGTLVQLNLNTGEIYEILNYEAPTTNALFTQIARGIDEMIYISFSNMGGVIRNYDGTVYTNQGLFVIRNGNVKFDTAVLPDIILLNYPLIVASTITLQKNISGLFINENSDAEVGNKYRLPSNLCTNCSNERNENQDVLSSMIDVKNRKSISSYPIARMIYDKYLFDEYCRNPEKTAYTYDKLHHYIDNLGTYWIEIVEQLIPSTSIWSGLHIYRNTIFDQQKFKYKNYSLFPCMDQDDIDEMDSQGICYSRNSEVSVYEEILPKKGDKAICKNCKRPAVIKCEDIVAINPSMDGIFYGSVTILDNTNQPTEDNPLRTDTFITN